MTMKTRHGRRSFGAMITALSLALAPTRPASAAEAPDAEEAPPTDASTDDEAGPGEASEDDANTDANADANADATATPRATKSPPPQASDAPARASLAVDTSAVGAQSPVLLRRIEELGDITLRRSEILPGRTADDPVISIRIRSLDEGGYAIDSHLLVGGQIAANSEHTVLCTLCTEGETVDRARVEVERLVPFVRSHAEARARDEEARRKANVRKPPPPPPPKAPRLSVKGKVGASLLAVGGVTLGVGIGLAARRPRPNPDMPLETIETRVPGYILAGVGGALILTGVSLLLAARSETSERRVQVAPTARGFVITGRF